MSNTKGSILAGVQISQELDERFSVLAQNTGRNKNVIINQALSEYLEDYEDLLIAQSRLEKGGKEIPFREMEKELGLDRDFE